MRKTHHRRKRRKLLSLENYASTLGGLAKLKQDIQRSLRPFIFEIDSMQQLHFEALKFLKPINASVKNNQHSIEKSIDRVLAHYRLGEHKASLKRLTFKGSVSIKTKKDDPIDMFQKYILGLDKLPIDQLNLLKGNVENHLHKINDLTKHYEELTPVKKLLNNRRINHNHETKTILDFYNRCLAKRQVVLDYYLTGVYERAVDKARAQVLNFGNLTIFDHYHDYPYEYGQSYYGRSLDYRKIDCTSHRLNEVTVQEAPEYDDLYISNKEKFYSKLFKIHSKREIFQNIEFNLSHVPMNQDRTVIFKELKRLFNSRRWLPFYALALPQVEGLFAEMALSANPESKALHKTLPDKVKSVRPDYALSDTYFDYYEYVLPKERNTFSHTGYTEDFKHKAFDLLTDLEHVLSVFADLNNPFVKITKMIKRRNQMAFVNAKGFAEYFTLLDSLHPKQIQERKTEISKFNDEFLKKDCSLESVIQESARELETSVPEIHTKIEYHFTTFDLYRNFGSLTKPQMDKFKNDEKFHTQVVDFFMFYSEIIQEVFTIQKFFHGLTKYLFKGKQESVIELEIKVWKRHKDFVNNLHQLKRIVPDE